MTERNKWKWGLFGLGAAAIIGLSSTMLYASVYAQTEVAQTEATQTETRDETPFKAVPRQEKFFALGGDQRALLAQALGISEAELEAAMIEARNAALDQAVEDGKITQEQADQVRAGELGERWHGGPPGMMGIGPMALGPLSFGRMGAGSEYEEALAAALGITVEDLQAAKAEIPALLLADAVTAGKITQEEADLIGARMALREYMQEVEQSAYEETVAEAVAAGVITQEQADQLLSEGDRGLPGWGRFGRDNFGLGVEGGHHGWHRGGRPGGHFEGPRHGPHGKWFSLPGGDQSPEGESPENSNAPSFELPAITL